MLEATPYDEYPSLELTPALTELRKIHLSAQDWQQEMMHFVPLAGSWLVQSEHSFDLDQEVYKFLSGDKKVLLLLGDSGAGKSLYTQGLACKLWESRNAKDPIPLWISLPSFKKSTDHLIQDYFKSLGFTGAQIDSLQKNHAFIFILDAYDEIRTLNNLYVSHQLAHWQGKVIITCRREYLYFVDNYRLHFAPYQGEHARYKDFLEIIIRPFETTQIQQYLQQYIKNHETVWPDWQQYEKAIETIPGLKNLITTPFMLKLAVDALPKIMEQYQTTKALIPHRYVITQAALYDVFIEQWFLRQEEKLKNAELIPKHEDIKPEFWNYAKQLAQAMHAANITQIDYEESDASDLFGEVETENPWKVFLNPNNPRTALLQTACWVRKVGTSHYAFVHVSLLEYFLTRNLYESITVTSIVNIEKESTQQTLDSEKKPEASESQVDKWINDYFNQRLLVKETNTLQFLADRIHGNKGYKQALFKQVKLSKKTDRIQIAAANAITILNSAHIPFSGLDLSGINIPYANLNRGNFYATDLSGANLHAVQMHESCLWAANLAEANLKEIDFGITKPIAFSEEGRATKRITSMVANSDHNNILVIGYEDGVIICAQISPLRILYTIDLINDFKPCKELHTIVRSMPKEGRLNFIDSITTTTKDSKHAFVALSNDGQYIGATLGEDHELNFYPQIKIDKKYTTQIPKIFFTLYDFETGKIIRKFIANTQIPNQHVNQIAFCADNKQIATGSKEGIRLWNLSGDCTIHINNIRPICIGFNPRQFDQLAIGLSSSLELWQITPNGLIANRAKLKTRETVKSLAYHPDGNELATGGAYYNPEVTIWDLKNYSIKFELKGKHTKGLPALAYRPDGKQLASISIEGVINYWAFPDYRCENQVLVNSPPWLILYVNENFIRVSDRRKIFTHSCNTSYRSDQLAETSHTRKIGHLLYFDNNKKIVSKSSIMYIADSRGDDKIRIWDIQTVKNQILPEKLKHIHISCLLNFNSQQLFGCGVQEESAQADITACLWDLTTGQEVFQFKNYPYAIASLTYNPLTRQFATGGVANCYTYGNPAICVWELSNNILRQKYINTSFFDSTHCIVFSHSGHQIATASDKTIRIWNHDLSQCQASCDGQAHITLLAYYPDDSGLLSVNTNGEVLVWSLKDWKIINHSRVPCHTGAAITPDFSNLALGVRESLWQLSIQNVSNLPKFPEIPLWRLKWRCPDLSLDLSHMNINKSEASLETRELILANGGIEEHQTNAVETTSVSSHIHSLQNTNSFKSIQCRQPSFSSITEDFALPISTNLQSERGEPSSPVVYSFWSKDKEITSSFVASNLTNEKDFGK